MKSLNKRTVTGMMLVCSLMSAATVTPIGAANYTTPTIVIDSRTIQSDTAPYIVSGTTLVPLRVISENMGASVDWNEAERKVTVKKGNTTITLQIDEYLAYVNGDALTISMAPRISNGRTMVPLRFIGETLDCEVGWDAETKTVIITTNGETTEVPVVVDQVDQFGRKIRTTNLPSNAANFPYIAEEIPNWCYENQEKILKNNYWGPTFYTDTNLHGLMPSELDPQSDSFPITGSMGTYDLVNKFVGLQTNIDYNTIGDDWVKGMLSCFSDTEMKAIEATWKDGADGIETFDADLQDFVKTYKQYSTVTSSEYKVMPEAMWVDVYGLPHVPVYIKYTINNENCQDPNKIFNVNYGGSAVTESPAYGFKVGQTYEGVVTYTLTKDSKGAWKIACCNCDIDVQLRPSTNATDALKPDQVDSNQESGFLYEWSTKVVDRYAHPQQSDVKSGYNPVTGLVN